MLQYQVRKKLRQRKQARKDEWSAQNYAKEKAKIKADATVGRTTEVRARAIL